MPILPLYQKTGRGLIGRRTQFPREQVTRQSPLEFPLPLCPPSSPPTIQPVWLMCTDVRKLRPSVIRLSSASKLYFVFLHFFVHCLLPHLSHLIVPVNHFNIPFSISFFLHPSSAFPACQSEIPTAYVRSCCTPAEHL